MIDNLGRKELSVIDVMTIVDTYLQINSLYDIERVQAHLDEIEDKLDWIIEHLKNKGE